MNWQGTNGPEPYLCPDCKQPVSTHDTYRDGRCPVVVFRGVPRVDVIAPMPPLTDEMIKRLDEGTWPTREMSLAEVRDLYG